MVRGIMEKRWHGCRYGAGKRIFPTQQASNLQELTNVNGVLFFSAMMDTLARNYGKAMARLPVR